MSYTIWTDESGVELKREEKTRGRPHKGAVKNKDGNWIVKPKKKIVKPPTFYITEDSTGKEIAREQKGRGRTKPDFAKKEDGHFHKVVEAVAPVTEVTVAEPAPVAPVADVLPSVTNVLPVASAPVVESAETVTA